MMTSLAERSNIEVAISEVRAELARADQKAATLLALFAALTAGFIAVLTTRDGGIFSLWNGVEWMVWAGLACLTCSLGCLLISIRPRYAHHSQGNAYFGLYAQYATRPEELFTHLTTTANDGSERCGTLAHLSILATRKYRFIACAVDLLGCSLALAVVAMLFDASH